MFDLITGISVSFDISKFLHEFHFSLDKLQLLHVGQLRAFHGQLYGCGDSAHVNGMSLVTNVNDLSKETRVT
jgi:hypothetical protein